MIESAKALGNLTLSQIVRRHIVTTYGEEIESILCLLLQHDDVEIMTAVCGIAVNISCDIIMNRQDNRRRARPEDDLVHALLDIVENLTNCHQENVEIIQSSCQALINLSSVATMVEYKEDMQELMSAAMVRCTSQKRLQSVFDAFSNL